MSPDEMIAVIQAHKDGKGIEVQCKGHKEWGQAFNPRFDFHNYNYRIKAEKAKLCCFLYKANGSVSWSLEGSTDYEFRLKRTSHAYVRIPSADKLVELPGEY